MNEPKGFGALAGLFTKPSTEVEPDQPATPVEAATTAATVEPATPVEPATVEPTANPENAPTVTADAGAGEAAVPVAANPETPTSDVPTVTAKGTVKGDRGAPPAKPKGETKAQRKAREKAARDARLGKGKPDQPATPVDQPAPATPIEPATASPSVEVAATPATETDMTNVLGYDLTRWPNEPGLPPLNPVWRHQQVDAATGKPVTDEHGQPVMIETTLSMIDFIRVAHASHIMTRPVTKQALALACYCRPDAHKYSLEIWAYVLRVVFDPHNSVLDPKRNIITRATQGPHAMFVYMTSNVGNRKTYRLSLTAYGLGKVRKALTAENAAYQLPQYFTA
jgi:hypothetical protein